MTREKRVLVAPFFSVSLIVLVTVGCVFLKMERVRLNYELVKVQRAQKLALSKKAQLEITYAKLVRPERLDIIATGKLNLSRARKDQVILVAAQGDLAIRQ